MPYDADALMCVDKDTCAEWDALNPYQRFLGSEMLAVDVAELVLADVEKLVLKPLQGGISNVEAVALTMDQSDVCSVVAYENLDPTQASFVDHMGSWWTVFSQDAERMEQNLPPLVSTDGERSLVEPILLLGTAGTGKTTRIQAANAVLQERGLEGKRIIRAAFTGVAASNMGAGGRTLMSLFRLPSSKQLGGGPLPPFGQEEMEAMAEELGRLAVLEIDELSMNSEGWAFGRLSEVVFGWCAWKLESKIGPTC